MHIFTVCILNLIRLNNLLTNFLYRYGEIVNINLIRDKDTGKSKGFCFICYEDQRSTDIAVDNFNGIKILNRTIRVDHVSNYKVPKDGKKTDAEVKKLHEEGCAPKPIIEKTVISMQNEEIRETLADQITADIRLPKRLPIYTIKDEPKSEEEDVKPDIKQKVKKSKKKKKHKKKRSRDSSDASDSDNSSDEDSSSKKKCKKKKKWKESSGDSSDNDDKRKRRHKK